MDFRLRAVRLWAAIPILFPMIVCALAVGWPALSRADDGVAPYREFSKKIQAAQSVEPLTDAVFGDSLDLYTGSGEFGATDVTLPGNDALPVQVNRRLVVEDRTFDPGNLGGFADWDLDVPWIEGTFVAEDGWQVSTTGNPNDRCSITAVPNTHYSLAGGNIWLPDVWSGNRLHIPGGGDQELLVNNQSKSPAYPSRSTYPWVTKSGWKLRCVASLADSYPGEGFVAVSPSGVQYTFNWMIVHAAPDLKEPRTGTVNGYIYVPRSHIFLVATEVDDRFGNWVKYAWSGDHLTGISSKDGRSITINWSGSTISSIVASGRTWNYLYGTANGTDGDGVPYSWTYLSSVTQPDTSRWTYSYNGGMYLTSAPVDDLLPNQFGCQDIISPEPSGGFGYTIGAPSGATGTFNFVYALHHRADVPKACTGTTAHPVPPANTNYPMVYSFFQNFTIASKLITGPGLPAGMKWTYDYAALEGRTGYTVASQPWNYDDIAQPYIPPTCTDCSASADLVVTGPTAITRYTFGMEYAHDEGQLLATQVEDLSGNPLKTTTSTYASDAQAAGAAYPNIAGQGLLPNYTSPMGNRNRPVMRTVIGQEGATFTTSVNSFDAFARATSETESSSLGYSKTDTTSYQDDVSRWVLGLETAATTNGIASSQTSYTTEDLPYQQFAFGKLVSTKTWNSDGTLATVVDGDGNATTLGSWYRGLPQSVKFADGTARSAVINTAGWITSIADEGGFTTSYAYDAMGRLAQITYPAGDDVAWNPTLASFTQVAGAEFGIPGGHWKQVVQTGNAFAVTFFDALWQPLVSEHYDAGNQAGTLAQTVTNYDAGGRKIFASYPSRSVTGYTQSLPGSHTTYDALSRVVQVSQDSELGALPTTTAYLSGFQTRITDPRGYGTTTTYQAYGTPTTQWPVSINAPQGELTVVQRDVFGKPLSIVRTGTAPNSPGLTRNYVYDGYQQLCKRIEPESGTTAFGYDGAGNLSWSAAGLNLPDADNCDTSAAQGSGRVATRAYDKRNRLLSIGYPDGSSNSSFVYYTDGALQTQTVSNGGNPVTTSYAYDKRRLLTQETLSIVNTTPFTLNYGHDVNGHLASTTYPDGRAIGYAPNALGQPTQAGVYASGATYYPNGAMASFAYGSGAVHRMTENTRGLPSRNTDTLNGVSGMDFGHAYDGNGNVAAITDYLPGNVGNRDMVYDGLNRLTEADSPMFEGDGKALYHYDVLDNILSARVGNYSNLAYAYTANGQLAALMVPGTVYDLHTYLYDAQGNLSNKDGEPYQFDMANRLRNVPGVASYLYDASGRRAQKNETLYGGGILDSVYSKAGQLMYQWQPATQNATDYIYLGDTLVARVVANNAQTPPPNVPATPASISVTPAISNTGTFSVSWAAVSGANRYVLWQNANNGGANSVYSGTNASTTINGLASGHYVYQVQACNDSGCSGFATSSSVAVIPAPPASITVPVYNFSATIPVSWQASSLANNYVLEEYPYNGGWGVAYTGANTSKTLTVPGSGTYQFQVSACGQGGCSAYTTSGNVAVTLSPTLSASTTSSLNGSFTLTWNAVPSATGYALYQNGISSPIQTGSATSWSASGFGDGSYTYTVHACNGGGCNGVSNPVTVTVNHIAAPGLSASTASSVNGTFSLSWNTVASATSYQLFQNGTLVYNSAGTTWASNALPDGSYAYTVRGCNGAICGFSSNQVTVAVQQVAPSLSASTTNSPTGSFTLNWNTTAGATSYQLFQNGSLVYNAGGTSWSASGLGNGNYGYAVHACNASGCSSASNTVTVTVLKIPPAPTLSSSTTTSTTGSFTLTWTATTGASRYQLNQNLGGHVTVVYNAGGTSWSSSNLAVGTYSYQVYACNATGCSPGSNGVGVSVVPAAPATVGAPGLAHVGTIFHVTWSSVGNATSYQARETDTATGTTRLIYDGGTATTAPVQPTTTGTYQYAARACAGSTCSGWTSVTHTTRVEGSIGSNAVPATGSGEP